jgi:hypothetical protein
MPSEWYCSRDDQKIGPVSTEQLRQAATSGKLLPTDLVWKEGMPEWAQAKRLKGLFPESMPPTLPQGQPVPAGNCTFLSQTVFEPIAGETIIKEGLGGYMSSCATCYVTNRRFVVCVTFRGLLGLLWKGTKITCEIPWDQLMSIERGTGWSRSWLIFKTLNGKEYKVGGFLKKGRWYAAIQRASGISF